MLDNSQSGDQNLQDDSQATSGNSPGKETKTPTGNTEEPKYTEAQWRSMQSNLRKQAQELKNRITEMESENLALKSVTDDNEALKSMVAELTGKIEEGIPDDAKSAFQEWGKKTMAHLEERTKLQKQIKQHESELKGYKDVERKQIATQLAKDYGVSADDLLTFTDVRDMKAYALDNGTPTARPQMQAGEEAGEVPEQVAERPPTSGSPGGGGQKSTFTSKEIDSMDVKTFAQHREAVLKALAGGKIKD